MEFALAAGIAAADGSLPRETGGVLAGWRTAEGLHVVQMLEVPSRKATRSRYVRSQRKANAVLDSYLRGLPPASPVGYVGDWHSHPEAQGASDTDLASIAEFAKNDGLPVALLVLVRRNKSWEADAWHAASRRGRVRLERAAVEIVAE